jgi:hypothetical protein
MKPNKIIEHIAMGVGGLSLFMVSFLVFALAAGVPANEVAIVGGLFPAPAPSAPATGGPGLEAATPDVVEKDMDDIMISTLDRLPVYTHQSPYSDDELSKVVEELKRVKMNYEDGIVDLEQREEDIAKRSTNLDEKARILDDLMETLDRQKSELLFLQEELDRDIVVKDEIDEARWKVQSEAFADTEKIPELSARLMIYSAEEAAHILSYLEAEQRTSLLNAIEDDNTFKEYNNAYSALTQ